MLLGFFLFVCMDVHEGMGAADHDFYVALRHSIVLEW